LKGTAKQIWERREGWRACSAKRSSTCSIATLRMRTGWRLWRVGSLRKRAGRSWWCGLAIVARWFTPKACRPKLVVARRVVFRPGGLAVFGLDAWKYHRAEAIIAVSDAVRAGLLSCGVSAERVTVVRDGVEVERFARVAGDPAETRRSLGLEAHERIVLQVGHLGEEKGQRALIAATPAIRAKRSDVRVVIVGEGALRQSLERQAESLGVAPAVLFSGFRPPEEIPRILQVADVFAFPSVQEGLGSSLLEAMAAGLPIVATRIGGIGESIRDGETGLLVPPGDSPRLAQAILRLLDDGALSARLARSAQQWVGAEGTKERLIRETIRVYERVATGPS